MTCKFHLPKMAFLALLLFVVLSCNHENRKLQQMEAAMDSISLQLANEIKRSDSLEQVITKSGTGNDIPVYFERAFDTIENPEEYIVSALREQRQKIPINAVLGGNMDFRQVDVLTEDWVLAQYDDGHIQGKSIYKYELQPSGKVKFTEVVSKLPE